MDSLKINELVRVVPLQVDENDSGSQFDVLRSDDVMSFIDFGQTSIASVRSGAVHAFRYHDMLTNHFTVVSGAAVFCLWSFPGNYSVCGDDSVRMKPLLGKLESVRSRNMRCDRTPAAYDQILGDVDDWFLRIVVTAERPVRIDVPPGVVYGWCALEPRTVLLRTGSECRNQDEPDEFKLPWDLFGDGIWAIQCA